MKKLLITRVIPIIILSISLTFLYACNDDNNDIEYFEEIIDDPTNQSITESDKEALLFMLEEEKLARDTYDYLDNLWSINQFANIRKSEQSHMDSVENLLKQANIAYTILPYGEFNNAGLQQLYDQFKIDGAQDISSALQIGATIEDLDIKDLQDYLDRTTHPDIIAVFENLQCGSRNHLISFVSSIENGDTTYTPQFITQVEYDLIIAGNHEQCN